ncbi:MAG: tetratricopeptide repeat protein [Candidatus Pelagibacter sp.]
MYFKILRLIIILLLSYQTSVFSKSNSFDDFDREDLSNYFSGIVAFENKNISEAFNFFKSSKSLINDHDLFLQRYANSMILDNNVAQAINIIKKNENQDNSKFFEAYILLALDSLKKNNFDQVDRYLDKSLPFANNDGFKLVIFETLKQFVYVFKEGKIQSQKKNYGNLTYISEIFQRCYLNDEKTGSLFFNLINNSEGDYSRYIHFYLNYLISIGNFKEAENIASDLNIINTPILLSQTKLWIENKNFDEFEKIFSCKNSNDLVGEFLFLISNLYSSQNDFQNSNIYLNLSNYLNPKFKFNLSLVAENYYLNNDFDNAKNILKNFEEKYQFYYWFRIKKEAQILIKQGKEKQALNHINEKFTKIKNPNIKFVFEMGDFNKNLKEYESAIKYYTTVMESLDPNSDVMSDLLYRRGGSYERLGDYVSSDQDLLEALKINPDDAYTLNYLAYSWLERNFKISEAIEMLERAYASKRNDPYIIDSIGWAYYLTDDYSKAEPLLREAVELMPDDPTVNDHYGDVLWKLDRKIQARYFWNSVLNFEDTDADMKKKISIKLSQGMSNS